MTNEIIGIVGVLVLTFLLFGLRHFILTLGRVNRNRNLAIAPRENQRLNMRVFEDDAWLLWAPDLKTEIRVDRGRSQDRGRGDRSTGLRYDDTTS